MNVLAKNDNQLESTLFQINMSACRTLRPSLWELLSTTKESGRYHFFQSEHESRAYNLVDVENEKLFYELNDPIASMAAHLETCINRLQGIMVCLGFGLGYAPLMLVKQKNYVSRSIVIIEPDPEVLLCAFKTLDCRTILESEDILMLVGFELDEISPAVQNHIFQNNRLINAKNLQIVDLPAAVETNGEYYLEAVKRVTSSVYEGVKFVGNCPNDALQGLDNTLSNALTHIKAPGLNQLSGVCAGMPGIVVASGPSLDKNVHLLKGLENHAVICSADASLRHLLRRNLKPHLIACMERLDETALLFQNLDPTDYQDVSMVAAPVIHHKTYEAYEGPIISTEREYGYQDLIAFDKGRLAPGPSAGNYAFRILRYLGCDPIILIGQDLALDAAGKTHASGDPYGDEQDVYKTQPVMVEGNYTDQLPSNPILKMFHYAYECDVADPSVTVINATEGGAKIAGTILKTFSEAIEDHLKEPIDKDLRANLSISDFLQSKTISPSADQVSEDFQTFKDRLNKAVTFLDEVDEVIETAAKAADDFRDLIEQEAAEESELNTQRDTAKENMNKVSALSTNSQFREIAMDTVSAIFFHTMADYVHAMANAETDKNMDLELIKNIENLTNNFRVLLRYVRSITEKHLDRIDQGTNDSATFFERQSDLEVR
ncbi:MAG: 6-hydroxymethylpterin diphosphokinase MptE-like protein [Pseudomonadota bacterium]